MMVVTISMSNIFFELSFDYIQKNVVDKHNSMMSDASGIGHETTLSKTQRNIVFTRIFRNKKCMFHFLPPSALIF